MAATGNDIISKLLVHYTHLYERSGINSRAYSTVAYIRHILREDQIHNETAGNTSIIGLRRNPKNPKFGIQPLCTLVNQISKAY